MATIMIRQILFVIILLYQIIITFLETKVSKKVENTNILKTYFIL